MKHKYTTTFSSILKPLVSEEKDKYLALASLVEVGNFIPNVDTEKNIDLLPVAFNAAVVNRVNKNGDVISWSSAGKMGFRGSKKNTPYAAQLAAEDCAKVAHEAGLRKVKVYVKGPGNGRESAIRSIHNSGIEVTEIIDVTPMPHNGCRPPKRRRV